MTRLQNVLVPFAYTALATARRDRTPKHHAVFETLPAMVPVLEADGAVEIRYGNARYRLPVVAGRVARPSAVSAHGEWTYDTVFLDEANAEAAIAAHMPDSPTADPWRWRDAPIPIEELRPDGSFCRASDLRSVSSSDRDERLRDAVEACGDLTMIGGRLCRFDDEPLLPVHVMDDGPTPVFRIGEPVFMRSALRGAGQLMRHGRNWSSSPMHLRPDEVASLVAGGADVRSIMRSASYRDVLEISGDVGSVAWKTDSAAVSRAGTFARVHSDMNDIEERWNRMPFGLREAVLACSHEAMRTANGAPASDDAPEMVARLASALARVGAERRSPSFAHAEARLAEYTVLASACGWDGAPAPETRPDDPSVFDMGM